MIESTKVVLLQLQRSKSDYDLDMWCYMVDGKRDLIEQVGFPNLESDCGSVLHQGDSSFSVEIDSEQMQVNLKKLKDNIHHLFFVLTIFTAGKYLHSLKDMTLKVICGQHNYNFPFLLREYQTNTLPKSKHKERNSVIVGILSRIGKAKWKFRPLGTPADKTKLQNIEHLFEQINLMSLYSTSAPLLQNSSQQTSHSPSTSAASLQSLSNLQSPTSPLLLHSKSNEDIKSKESGLKIIIKEAKGLTAKDFAGTSDPYCEFKCIYGKSVIEGKTRKKLKTLNPRWDHAISLLEIPPDITHVSLFLTVYDWDQVTKDDFLGHVEIQQLDITSPKTYTLPLQHKKKKSSRKKKEDETEKTQKSGEGDTSKQKSVGYIVIAVDIGASP